ncbi:MAG: type II toxin-antitoxin system death-on-curing family toxin [Candidatus Aenigmarchaeota archaeon]|nr:type II toxin-antitoxin system death-on-curing family toxin [Candidatus Aenigmarchaeota archaeon]
MKYLTTQEILHIHDDIIKETGGHGGILSYGNLDFIVNQMKIPKTIERSAIVLFYGILTSHPFVDGNKRTGLESMKTFLYLNGKRFVAEDNDIWSKVHDTSEGKLKFEEIINWIKKSVK